MKKSGIETIISVTNCIKTTYKAFAYKLYLQRLKRLLGNTPNMKRFVVKKIHHS